MKSVHSILSFELRKAWGDYEHICTIITNVIEELGWTIHEGRVRIKIDRLPSDESQPLPVHIIKDKEEMIEQAEKTVAEMSNIMIWTEAEADRLKQDGGSPHTLVFWCSEPETLMEYLWSARDRGVATIANIEWQVLGMQSQEVPSSSIMRRRGRWTRVDMTAGS
ncbi:hypothetical protein P153DRAFT_387561 [Dothidotthia symphoricarpi CBS 119687]|uniref:Uncharacterized protein n=1 Tax=Dothidotthia symphoricarpi CBS 119687 TaxID=1392245 RepID=A0A6A6A9F9_9PLEO|nr:uncharacterized protein P153DRAFT_387561 [Dothidotthia symphoricarpi CBS 119687]KAF2127833.1 hypothetical protein P153DRAFT_387561 [Dothidotthia symphoricarpi CBS 119687]